MTTISNEMHEAIMSKMQIELESLRQENSRLREALEQIVKEGRYPGSSRLTAHIADEALNPPKRS